MLKAWWEKNYDVVCFVVGIILILWLFAAAKGIAGTSCTTMSGIEPRYLTHQMDGDTISLFSIPQGKMKFRIDGIDTPERGQDGWEEARQFTWLWLHKGPFALTTWACERTDQ